MSSVECQVNFESPPRREMVGTLRVRVVEVGRADASATVVVERVVEECRIGPGLPAPVVVLDVPQPQHLDQFAVEAHFDVDGSGETAVGDYRTMENFPLGRDAAALGVRLEIRVRVVS